MSRRALVVAAFATLDLVWGSTYLAIAVAVRSWPPFFMAAVRFLLAGTVLYAVARWRGAPAPDRAGWRRALWVGGGLIGAGNGGLVWAQQVAKVSVAALVLATVPLWVGLYGWARGTAKPSAVELGAMALGVAGIALLVAPGAAPPAAMAALLV